jgi:hypothetical protein
LPAEAATIAAKVEGYATGQVVKNHFVPQKARSLSSRRRAARTTMTLNDLHRIVCKRINAP